MKILNKFSSLAILLAFLLIFPINFSQLAMAREDKPTAVIVKVDGPGTARVRRTSGIETAAGAPMELSEGDRISTDMNAMIDLVLFDGTLVRIGINSEYKIESAIAKKGIIRWVFSLAKGSIRALVEKSSDKKTVRFRVNTPAGTVGVRGTELLLEHSEETKRTKIFTLHGLVGFGALNCDSKNKCVSVAGGKMSAIKVGQLMPDPPRDFTTKEILGEFDSPKAENSERTGSMGQARTIEEKNRLNLLLDSVGAVDPGKISEEDLNKIIEKAKSDFQSTQNFFLGRDDEIRKRMDSSRANGTIDGALAITNKYLAATQKGQQGLEAGGLNSLSGPAQSAKFKLTEALLKASIASNVTVSGAGKTKSKVTSIGGGTVAGSGGTGAPNADKASIGYGSGTSSMGGLGKVESPETNYAHIDDPGAGITASDLQKYNYQIEQARMQSAEAAAAMEEYLNFQQSSSVSSIPLDSKSAIVVDSSANSVAEETPGTNVVSTVEKKCSINIGFIHVVCHRHSHSHAETPETASTSKERAKNRSNNTTAPCMVTKNICVPAACAPSARLGCANGTTTQSCTTKQVPCGK